MIQCDLKFDREEGDVGRKCTKAGVGSTEIEGVQCPVPATVGMETRSGCEGSETWWNRGYSLRNKPTRYWVD